VDIILSHGLKDNLEAIRSWMLAFLVDCCEYENLPIFYNCLDSNIDAVKKADHNPYEIILQTSGDPTRTRLSKMTAPLFSKAIITENEGFVQRMLAAGWNARLAYSAFEVYVSLDRGGWHNTIYKVTGCMLKIDDQCWRRYQYEIGRL